MDEITEPACRTLKEYFFYKLDRNLAIGGIIIIGVLSLFKVIGQDNQQLPAGAISALGTYIGIRSAK